jgi:hypothetical protein
MRVFPNIANQILRPSVDQMGQEISLQTDNWRDVIVDPWKCISHKK